MKTRVSNVKLEKGKWYLLRPDVPYHLWVAFTPKRTVKFDTVLKDMCHLQNVMSLAPTAAFGLAIDSRNIALRYSKPKRADIAERYVICFCKSADGKSKISAYAERVALY
jgi:hypothetical protein